MSPPANSPLYSAGMLSLLLAQFLSAMADNAILVLAIAVLKTERQVELIPFLQACFIVPFILLAPWAGPLADSMPKAKMLLHANTFKLFGATLMAAGLNPIAAYGLIGIGATLYSPAKYGILSQMFSPHQLVKANGLLEGSTIVAILLGVVLGGWLSDHSLAMAFLGIMGAYALASVSAIKIPLLPPERIEPMLSPVRVIQCFSANMKIMMANPDIHFSLLGTSLFWASGTTLRLLLFAWVPISLGITDNSTPADLMGLVSVGIVAGAFAAGRMVSLESVNRALPGGLLLGPVLLLLSQVHHLWQAALLMGLTGLCGGYFVVPLNALLQERGHETRGAGHALAIQNFFENLAMMLFVGLYSISSMKNLSPEAALKIFAALLIISTLGLTVHRLKNSTRIHDGQA